MEREKKKKKILLLGGANTQIPSILTAKKMGYYTITCDYLPDNPGHKFADEYHNVSTTDKEAVLALAKELQIDGILAYATDVAAATAAYVSEAMGFPTSPYKSVDILTNKDKFRAFLEENGFCTPRARGYSSVEEAKKDLENFKFPVMVKPVDSAGSKGVARMDDAGQLEELVENALQYSRCKRFIIEEYVEKYRYQIAGDGFSVDGKLVFRCFANEHFSNKAASPYVPIGESFPYDMPKEVHEKVHAEIQRLLTLLDMKTQAYNFDIRIDKDYNVYLMEVGPRNGGNMIAQVIEKATGIPFVEYMLKAAMGEDCSELKMVEPEGFWSCYILHTLKEGNFKRIQYTDEIKKNIVEEHIHVKEGEKLIPFTGSNGTVGVLILRYDSMEEMLHKMDNMYDYITVEVE